MTRVLSVAKPDKVIYNKIFSKLREHNKWFENSIPLIASENIPSPAVREAIISDFGNRYAEGWPGERVYAGCTYIDEVEFECMKLARKLYKAKFADVRPISGVVANLVVYSAFTSPGDIMLAPSIPAGGHISHGKREHSGTAGLVHGLEIEFYPFNAQEMTIDVDKSKQKVKNLKKPGRLPKMAMFGGSLFLFPHPVKELADFLKGYGMHVNYDAAHVAGLIAGGKFQNPLREGADTMTMSTHKTLFGPQEDWFWVPRTMKSRSRRRHFRELQAATTSTIWQQRQWHLQRRWSLGRIMQVRS